MGTLLKFFSKLPRLHNAWFTNPVFPVNSAFVDVPFLKPDLRKQCRNSCTAFKLPFVGLQPEVSVPFHLPLCDSQNEFKKLVVVLEKRCKRRFVLENNILSSQGGNNLCKTLLHEVCKQIPESCSTACEIAAQVLWNLQWHP